MRVNTRPLYFLAPLRRAVAQVAEGNIWSALPDGVAFEYLYLTIAGRDVCIDKLE